MGTLKIFMKEKNKKELLEELKLIQDRIAVSELQETKKEKNEKDKKKNIEN
jgi:hypothetical protein